MNDDIDNTYAKASPNSEIIIRNSYYRYGVTLHVNSKSRIQVQSSFDGRPTGSQEWRYNFCAKWVHVAIILKSWGIRILLGSNFGEAWNSRAPSRVEKMKILGEVERGGGENSKIMKGLKLLNSSRYIHE